MTWLIYSGFLIAPAVSNLLPKYLPALQIFGAFFNLSNALIWAIVFLVLADKNSSKFVFTEFLNTSGWTSKGWVFILSMYVPIYGLYGTDGVMHLVEEMKNASRDAPVGLHHDFCVIKPADGSTASHGLVYGLGWCYCVAFSNRHVLHCRAKLGRLSASYFFICGTYRCRRMTK